MTLLAALMASAWRPATTSASTVVRLAIGPRIAGRQRTVVRHTSCKRRRVTSRLCCSPLSRRSALLYTDEPRAQVFLSNGTSDKKIDGWYLDTDATRHITGQREYFSDLDSGM